jgi:DNA-binding transcriptional MerR regulator
MLEKMTGVSVHTIRAWEKRYGALAPTRDNMGRRSYSKKDIKRLTLLKQVCELGYAISHIATKSDSELIELRSQFDLPIYSQENVMTNSPIDKESETRKSVLILLMALKSYRLEVVSSEIEKLVELLTPREFVFEVVAPIMSEIGRAIEIGEYSISQEHALSSILKFNIGQLLYSHKALSHDQTREIAICTIEGDTHEFGILMAALLASHYKINFYYLGPNLPALAAADAARFLNVRTLLISGTTVVNTIETKKIKDYIANLEAALPSNVEIIWGGEIYIVKENVQIKRARYIKTLEQLDRYFKEM